MGKIHRYYTKDDMRLLDCAGRLVEAGLSLEELKSIIPDLLKAKENRIEIRGEAVANEKKEFEKIDEIGEPKITEEMKLAAILERALQNNNVLLEQGISSLVSDSIRGEMSQILETKNQMEEERFMRLDGLIRQLQAQRKDSGKKGFGIYLKEMLSATV